MNASTGVQMPASSGVQLPVAPSLSDDHTCLSLKLTFMVHTINLQADMVPRDKGNNSNLIQR